MSDPLHELERQVERGNLFAHSAMTETVARLNEATAVVNGLVGLLVQRGVVSSDELLAVVDAVRTETEKAGQEAKLGIAVRKDGEDAFKPDVEVDCEARIPYCRGACCSFSFPLTVEEIERGGPLKWDLGRPYHNRRGASGYCHMADDASHFCTIYDERPTLCRQYTCVTDKRIWKDFDAMIPNTEFLDEHFEKAARGPVEIFMDAASQPAPAADERPA